jgi:hypothetical protein
VGWSLWRRFGNPWNTRCLFRRRYLGSIVRSKGAQARQLAEPISALISCTDMFVTHSSYWMRGRFPILDVSIAICLFRGLPYTPPIPAQQCAGVELIVNDSASLWMRHARPVSTCSWLKVCIWIWSQFSSISADCCRIMMMIGRDNPNANLCKARKSWARISCILARDGATPRVSGMFYKAVVQSILLFGSETWVMTNPMLKALESFHRRVARWIAGKQPYLNR